MNWASIFRVLMTLTLQGSVALVLVALLNFILGLFKAPRRVCALLWSVVLLRFLIPFGFTSPFSLYALQPVRQYFTESRVTDSLVGDYEAIVSGTPEFEYAVAAGAQPRRIRGLDLEYAAVVRQDGKLYPARTLGGTYAPLLVRLWLGGAAFCLAAGLARYGLLRRRVRFAYKAEAGVYTGACVAAPFVLGFLRPRIYLPAGLSGPEREYILLHERTHLRRGDPWFKLAFSLAVCLHWWNPWVWMGYKCLLSDIEAACDQAVLRALGSGVKADYSQSLLQFAGGGPAGLATPLAFGETAVKARVKQVLRYKKPRAGRCGGPARRLRGIGRPGRRSPHPATRRHQLPRPAHPRRCRAGAGPPNGRRFGAGAQRFQGGAGRGLRAARGRAASLRRAARGL